MGIMVITTDGIKELYNTNLQAMVDNGYYLISKEAVEDYMALVSDRGSNWPFDDEADNDS